MELFIAKIHFILCCEIKYSGELKIIVYEAIKH